jgi:hypothetical protein
MFSYPDLTMNYSVIASVPAHNVAANEPHFGGPASTYYRPTMNLSQSRIDEPYYPSSDTQFPASTHPSFTGHPVYRELQGSTMISAYTRTDSESSPVSTATNGVRIADQNLSPNNGQSEAIIQHPFRELRPKPPLDEPGTTQPFTYGPINPAFILTGADGSRRKLRGEKQEGNLILSSSSATAQTPRPPSRAPSRPATSCDLCKRQRVRCHNTDPGEQKCDNCARRGKESCTFKQRDESNNRPKSTATVDVEPPV